MAVPRVLNWEHCLVPSKGCSMAETMGRWMGWSLVPLKGSSWEIRRDWTMALKMVDCLGFQRVPTRADYWESRKA
jgi:hypothetical protein